MKEKSCRRKEIISKLPSCIGNFGKKHSYCEEECIFNVVCEEATNGR